MPALTVVPGTRRWMLGVANVRGNLVAVIDLRHYIEGTRTVMTDSTRVLLVRQHGGSVGLLSTRCSDSAVFPMSSAREALGEEDERYSRYVGEKVSTRRISWGLFSMSALVRSAEFQQASA